MNETIESAGLAIYGACVDFLLQLSQMTGITYRDANALLFFVVWPVVTLVLLCIVLGQAYRLWRGGI